SRVQVRTTSGLRWIRAMSFFSMSLPIIVNCVRPKAPSLSCSGVGTNSRSSLTRCRLLHDHKITDSSQVDVLIHTHLLNLLSLRVVQRQFVIRTFILNVCHDKEVLGSTPRANYRTNLQRLWSMGDRCVFLRNLSVRLAL